MHMKALSCIGSVCTFHMKGREPLTEMYIICGLHTVCLRSAAGSCTGIAAESAHTASEVGEGTN